MKNVLMALVILEIAIAAPQDIFGGTMDTENIAMMQKGMDAVKARIKNPSSAKFRNVHFHRSSNGIPMTCGEVNSRDGLGDYDGFQKFISAGRSDLTLLESQVQNQGRDFSSIWKRFCE
ncbi:MAG: hypothetical protein PHI97_32830 [Desulfobulbus sp.]|nr:hypothetical protein [Desulfobulbus sp.]